MKDTSTQPESSRLAGVAGGPSSIEETNSRAQLLARQEAVREKVFREPGQEWSRVGSRYHGNNSSGGSKSGDERRRERYSRRRTLWSITDRKACAGCGRWPTSVQDGVQVVVQDYEDKKNPGQTRRRAHFEGTQTCKSVWLCPVCSASIRQRRADMVNRMCAKWSVGPKGKEGGSVLHWVATMRHSWGDDLAPMLALISSAFDSIFSGRSRTRIYDQFGIAGYVSTVEITVGSNGWHPHLHTTFLTKKQLGASEVRRMRQLLFKGWKQFIEREDGHEPVFDQCTLGKAERPSEAGDYILKAQDETGTARNIGTELMRGDLKEGRKGESRKESQTPFQILGEIGKLRDRRERAKGNKWVHFSEDDDKRLARCSALWSEYEEATKGQRSYRRGGVCRDRLKEEKEAREEREEEEIGEVAVSLIASEHEDLMRYAGAATRVLELVEAGAQSLAYEVVRRCVVKREREREEQRQRAGPTRAPA